MPDYRLLVSTGEEFRDAEAVLQHIGETLVREGVCRAGYSAALLAREQEYPTGIELECHAVAIPHCDAAFALEPAIYLIRPRQTVAFSQADDDGEVDAELIIALVVTDPAMQLGLLRTLFGHLQQNAFIEQLLTAPDAQLATCFSRCLPALAA